MLLQLIDPRPNNYPNIIDVDVSVRDDDGRAAPTLRGCIRFPLNLTLTEARLPLAVEK